MLPCDILEVMEQSRLICQLCNQERAHVVRVAQWDVCHECSADGPLHAALEAYDRVVALRKAVALAAVKEKESQTLQRFAEQRINAAQKELDLAITALIPVVTKVGEAREKARHALEQVNGFEDGHPYLKTSPE